MLRYTNIILRSVLLSSFFKNVERSSWNFFGLWSLLWTLKLIVSLSVPWYGWPYFVAMHSEGWCQFYLRWTVDNWLGVLVNSEFLDIVLIAPFFAEYEGITWYIFAPISNSLLQMSWMTCWNIGDEVSFWNYDVENDLMDIFLITFFTSEMYLMLKAFEYSLR